MIESSEKPISRQVDRPISIHRLKAARSTESAAVVRVHPSRLQGEVRVPGDKSLSHRALMLGALADGDVAVSGLAPSGDVLSTAAALVTMGATVELNESGGSLAGRVRGPVSEARDVVDCGNSGTSMRLLAGIAAGTEGLTVLTGDESLRGRPMDRVRIPLERMGAEVDGRDRGHLPPLVVRGGSLRAISYASPVPSAQVKSCILLAGLSASGRTVVRSPLPSRDHTERFLGYLGAHVSREVQASGDEIVTLEPGPLTARPLEVPGDPSSAAFWLVAAAPRQAAGPITTLNISLNPTRTGVLEVLRALGAGIETSTPTEPCGEPVGDVTVLPGTLTGATVAGRTVVDAIDELPILALAGALSRDGIEVRDAAELRVKESDRITALARLFAALDLRFEERPDGYRVPGGQRPSGGRIDAHGDHRIAMTAAIAGTYASEPVEITGFTAVGTSYPTFLDDLRSLGGQVEELS